MQGDLCILFPGFRIFKSCGSGIQVFSKHIHGKFRYIYFIKTQERQMVTGSVPVKSSYKTKFLLIYPVRNTIYDLIFLTIAGYLDFISGIKIFIIDIVGEYISYLRSIWGYSWVLYLVRTYHDIGFCSAVIHKVYAPRGPAENSF